MAEGPLLSRHLRRKLEAAGFQPTKAHEADVVITHSGGCYALPRRAKAKLFVHINPPYWPSKPLVKSLYEKILYDFRLRRQRHQLLRWAISLAANILYLFNLRRTLSMAWPYITTRRNFADLPDSTHLFIRTYIDSYCNPRALLHATNSRHNYLTLTGHHDDCWREPDQYVQLIQALHN